MEDVRRVLSQTLRQTAPKISFAFWTGGENLQNAQPILIETQKGLPLVKRGKQWARWSCGTKRTHDSAMELGKLKRADDTRQAEKRTPPKLKDSGPINPARTPEMHGQILKSLIAQAKDNSMIESSIPGASGPPAHKSSLKVGSLPSSFWARSPARKISAVFGHILYPFNTSDKMKTERKGPKPDPVLRDKQTFFNSRREILTSTIGPRSYLQKSRLSDIEESEELRIMLTPAQETDLAGPIRVFPGLMLYIRIDPDTKKASLAEVRLILEEREVDLLLPDKAADIRFLAESSLSAAGEVDPEIEKFFEASYLNVTGHQRLRTPKNLTLLIPSHATRTSSGASSDSKTTNSRPPPRELANASVSVDYTFTSLEHWSVVAGFDARSGFRLQYSIVEAGETGGRRDELRMMFVKHQPIIPKVRGRGPRPLPDFDRGGGNHVMKKRFKPFFDATVSLM